jgi:hypothetical protein
MYLSILIMRKEEINKLMERSRTEVYPTGHNVWLWG